MVKKLKRKDVKSKERKTRYKKMFAMWVSGMQMSDIAEELGCHLSTVQRACDWCRLWGYATTKDVDDFLLRQELYKEHRKKKYSNLWENEKDIKKMESFEKMISQLEKDLLHLKGQI